MNEIQILWLLLGVVIGLLISQVIDQSPDDSTSQRMPMSDSVEVESVRSQLRETELAYSMAVQMSQFKGSFLARTAHEVRSPLNGLIGVHQLILSDLCDDTAEEREFLAQAHTSALKLINLLDLAIDVAKLEQGNHQLDYQPIPLTALLNDVYNLTYLQAQNRNLRLQITPPDRDLIVQADLRRLQQMLISLVDAAIAQMQEGRITVSVPVGQGAYGSIWIETPLTNQDWTADLAPFTLETDQTVASLDKAAIATVAHQPFPSAGFAILVARSVLQSMNGQLEITATDETQTTRIECQIPLMPLAASVN